jgi:hypothetical protein
LDFLRLLAVPIAMTLREYDPVYRGYYRSEEDKYTKRTHSATIGAEKVLQCLTPPSRPQAEGGVRQED